jgi:hypothetical protein
MSDLDLLRLERARKVLDTHFPRGIYAILIPVMDGTQELLLVTGPLLVGRKQMDQDACDRCMPLVDCKDPYCFTHEKHYATIACVFRKWFEEYRALWNIQAKKWKRNRRDWIRRHPGESLFNSVYQKQRWKDFNETYGESFLTFLQKHKGYTPVAFTRINF